MVCFCGSFISVLFVLFLGIFHFFIMCSVFMYFSFAFCVFCFCVLFISVQGVLFLCYKGLVITVKVHSEFTVIFEQYTIKCIDHFQG